jgi:hypothetical protein
MVLDATRQIPMPASLDRLLDYNVNHGCHVLCPTRTARIDITEPWDITFVPILGIKQLEFILIILLPYMTSINLSNIRLHS